MAKVEYDVTSLVAFLRCAHYGPVEQLLYHPMVSGCSGGGVMLYVMMDLIKLFYALGVLRLTHNVVVYLVLSFLAVWQLTEIDRGALRDQEKFLYG